MTEYAKPCKVCAGYYQGIVLAIKTSVHATDALFFEVKMMSDQVTCEWCGCDDLYPDEMSDKEPGKCLECVQEECSHSNVLREYQGSNDHRVRFLELCCKCKQSREVRLYFHKQVSISNRLGIYWRVLGNPKPSHQNIVCNSRSSNRDQCSN